MHASAVADSYERDGFCFPLRAIDDSAAKRCLAERDAALARCSDDAVLRRVASGFANIVLPTVDELSRCSEIVDPVTQILGPDVLVLGASFFAKPAESPQFVSWHQDLTYWDLSGDDEVTAWVALTASTVQNGCMRFVPGSHRRPIVEHRDTDDPTNMLSRGQELAEPVAENLAVDVELAPGEMSLHHGRMFHASGPNRSTGPRIGVAVRYVAASMRQESGVRTLARLVAGEDRGGNFELFEGPTSVMDAVDVETARRSIALQDGIRLGDE
ncbi:MAG: phytanoyl-CoA dioxygenase family protein [Acidimicrobiales bacterium]